MPNQFLPFFLNSGKTALIGILNMMVLVGQCGPFSVGPYPNNDVDYKASSITSEDSLNYYPVKRLSIEKNKSPTNEGNYLSFTESENSNLNTYSSFQRESLEPESFLKRIRKRDEEEESSESEEAAKPESDEDEEKSKDESDEEPKPESSKKEPKPEEGKNKEEPKPESGEDEEPKPESGEKEEATKSESDEDDEPKPESGEKEGKEEAEKPEPDEIEEELKPKLSESAKAPKQNIKKPVSEPADEEEDLPPPPSKEILPPKAFEKDESSSLSTSNLEESLILPESGQEGMPLAKNQDTSGEDFVFQMKPLPSDISGQKLKSPMNSNQAPDSTNGMDSGPNEFLTEENWDDYSFYPRTFPSIWKGKKSRTIRPPQQLVSWNEFLVLQDKFQKNKLNSSPKKNNKLNSPFHKSKDDLYSYIEDAIRRNKQIEKELMDLKRTLQKSAAESKGVSQFGGLPKIVNNTLQLNMPLLQGGRLMPQEFKIKIEAEAPLKIKTQVGDGKANAVRFGEKRLRLEEKSSDDSNKTSTNKIQVREIPKSGKLLDKPAVATDAARESTFVLAVSTTEAEDSDPLKAERMAFIRKGAQFLRRAWYKYKQKRYPLLQP